jgi:hypothetical protein
MIRQYENNGASICQLAIRRPSIHGLEPNNGQAAVRSTQSILSATNGVNAEDSIETDRHPSMGAIAPISTADDSPPAAAIQAEQQSLLPGRLHVPW